MEVWLPVIWFGVIGFGVLMYVLLDGFVLGLGSAGIDLRLVLALLAGGLLAAPIAAWLVRIMPPRLLGSLVGGLIVVTNARTLLQTGPVAVPAATATAIYAGLALVWAAAVAWSVRGHRREQARAAEARPARVPVG